MSLLTEFVDIFGNPVYILKSLLTEFVDKKKSVFTVLSEICLHSQKKFVDISKPIFIVLIYHLSTNYYKINIKNIN
nr:MAG TPA: hypothetical protein [Caudoviricetes sp.]